jgi:hypothetical protein
MTLRAVAVLCLLSIPVNAQMPGQQPCGNVAEVIVRLGTRYGEVPMMRGTLAAPDNYSNGDMLLMGNAATGSWTILTIKNGMACIVQAGMSLTPMDKPEPEAQL